MKNSSKLPVLLLGLVLAASSAVAQTNVIISEFMAFNTRNLTDQDGEYSDWIEIYNAGTTSVNLLDWSLTDKADNLTQWRFPATNIGPGRFIVVFASGKNRRVAGAELHTSFGLRGGGEYLALVQPDGATIATQFAPLFPAQAADVSYGIGSLTTNLTFLTTNSAARVRVPASAADGTNWLYPGFDDAAWTVGTNGVGFGTTNVVSADYGAAVLTTAPVGYWRLNETSGTSAANIGSGTGLNGTYTAVTLGIAGPRPPQFNGFEAGNNAPMFNGSSSFANSASGLLSGRGAFTVGGWVKPAVTPGSRIGLFGQNDCVEFGFISGTTIECWTPGGGSMQVAYPFALNTWHHVVAVGDGTNLRVFLDGNQAGQGGVATASYGSSSFNFSIGGGGIQDVTGNYFNGQIDEVVVYHRALSTNEIRHLYTSGTNAFGVSVVPYVQTDIGPAMSNVNASAYVRLPFTVDNPTNFAQVTLRVRYDDGFVAYLNGNELVRVNAPQTPAYNSTATNTHSAATIDEFRFGASMLVPGTNILAIHGLNLTANDSDFLIVAELSGAGIAASTTNELFFTSPSPGAPNAGGVLFPGPAFNEVAHAPNVPEDNQDILVTARVVPTFYPMGEVKVRYQVMFGPLLEAPMSDSATLGDAVAGDGIYSALLPISGSSTNGEMVRWYFVATDATGTNNSRWPLFANPTDSAEYLGTIVDATNVTSKLPIFHLFAAPGVLQTPRVTPVTTATGADSEAGGRVSIFYDGEFYDNIYMELRGNTSAGQNKKSHRVVFNREHLFRHLPGYPRVRKTSLMAEFLDPAYLRQHLSFWLLEQMGVPSPYFYPVRAQLNGAFYGLVFHNDVIDVEQVGRMGYDPAGALYKAAGTCQPSEFSTGIFEKKAPEPLSDHTDYQTLVRAINETNTLAGRRIAAFDMLDLPEVINYLAGARWCAENDDVWANMSLYRDTYGDQLWRIIPFDMNASWGQRYGGITPLDATNDTCKSHPLYGGSTIIACDNAWFNRMYDVIIQVPEFRQMMLRRERTMMDRWILEPATDPQSRLLESHIRYMTNQIWAEAFLDRASWGYSTWAASNKPLTNAVDELFNEFINKRRIHFSVTHSVTNVAKPIGITPTSNAGIPLAQRPDVNLVIQSIEYSPSTGNQGQEYICISNTSPFAVDISDWKLEGGVDFTFQKGTVVTSNAVIYVSPDVRAFRTRTTGPGGGQGLFVVGPFSGQLSARGETLAIHDNYGRLVTTNSYLGTPSLAQQFLRVTEVMYHPAAPTSGSLVADDFEYLELKNTSPTVTLDLTGIRFVNGVDYTFTGGSLAPGQRVLVVANSAAFTLRYGAGLNVAGQYAGLLDNEGERVQLVDANGEEILDFTYNDTWYPVTDGLGSSLVTVNETAEPDLWSSKSNWQAGSAINGTPGASEPAPTLLVPVIINEVLSRSDAPPLTDSIELYNPTSTNASIGGWYLTDDLNTPKKFRIPDGTTITGGGYRVFPEADFNPVPGTPPSFGLSSDGDEVYLFSATPAGDLTGYVHGFAFGAADNGVSFGRYMTSDSNQVFVSQSALSPGAINHGPRVGPLVVSEIMFHPPDVNGEDNRADEFVEVVNISGATVLFHDPSLPTNAWKVTGGIDFACPTNGGVAPDERFLLVNFDPTNGAMLAMFQSKYGVSPGVQVFGPYAGKLNNDGDNVELKRATTPTPGGVPYVLIDKVNFGDTAPWPAGADGLGLSLQRSNTAAYGNDPVNWVAAPPTAAAPSATGGLAPVIVVQPASQSVLLDGSATLAVTATGSELRRYQWLLNGQVLPGATNASLQQNPVAAADMGEYSVLVFNSYGSVSSAPAFLTVQMPTVIVSQPKSVFVAGSTNVLTWGETTNAVATFGVSAYSPTPLSYQWRFNGVAILGATASSLTVSNITLAKQGNYDVVLTDVYGSFASSTVMLGVLMRPVIIVAPLSQTNVPLGGTFGVSVVIRGSPPPFYYSWRQGTEAFEKVKHVSYSTNDVFTYGPVGLTNSAFNWRIIVTNQALLSALVTDIRSFTVTVQSDYDQDGLPDAWEVANSYSTNDASNATADLDGDGMTLRQEYTAGTDPGNILSYLRIEAPQISGAATMEFIAVSNRTYSVEFTDELGLGWQRLADFVALGTNRVEQAVDPQSNPKRFYRLRTPARP